VWIPKPGSSEQRPLSIPAVRDRVVQAAVKIVIEPVFEADFLPCSFGFRPKRGAHDALQVLIDETWRGRRWLVETDIASCFEAIPHDQLMLAVEERVVDRHVLKLLRAMLRAGVMEDGTIRRTASGTPQGGVVSPLLANIYLHRVDRAWQKAGIGVLVRYADDLVVLCRTEREAVDALGVVTAMLAELGLDESGQDPDRASRGGRRGSRLPRLPPSLGARRVTPFPAHPVPCPLALGQGDATHPRPDP
jgi:RNA-directed DNA polymerase